VTVIGGEAPYAYSWTSSAGGTFSAPNSAITDFTAPHTMAPLQAIITCVITDNCQRRTFVSQIMTINASALPISLIDFQAKPQPNNTVKLEWATASEHNNNYFTLGRSSDGKSFVILKNIPSQGNGSTTKSYTHTDANPLKGTSYYRLSQTDVNGTQVHLQTEKVTRSNAQNASARITAGPNPFKDHITLFTTPEQEGEITVRIYDISGKMVRETSQSHTSASETIRIGELENLPTGTYILKTYTGENAVESIRIVKE
jgi:hypothetical protein